MMKQLLLNALLVVKDNYKNEKYTTGICFLLKKEISDLDDGIYNDIIDEFYNLVQKWPKYSGCIDYPVPSPYCDDDRSPEDIYWSNSYAETLWSGDYGNLRIELLDFMIDYLKNNS